MKNCPMTLTIIGKYRIPALKIAKIEN